MKRVKDYLTKTFFMLMVISIVFINLESTVMARNSVKKPQNLNSLKDKFSNVLPKANYSLNNNLNLSLMPFVYNCIANVENSGDVTKSAAILSNFEFLVCSTPKNLSQDELKVTEIIKNKVKIFGYIYMGKSPYSTLRSLSELKKQIDTVRNNNWHGVFIDQFGYDFGETRERQNTIVEYAHKKGLKCFVNSWFVADALGNKVVSKHNPRGLNTKLGEGDWYLLESFIQSNSGYYAKDDILFKCEEAKKYKQNLGINIATLTYKRDAVTWEQSSKDIENSYLLTLLMGFNAWWFTDKLENDSFIHGNPLNIDLGQTLISPLSKVSNDIYSAITEKLKITFDFKNYPDITYYTE